MANKKMTYYEKLTLVISALALLAAILSPFIAYYLLDPQLQAFRNRGRLQIESGSEPFQIPMDMEKYGLPKNLIAIAGRKDWNVYIKNTGNLPAKDVQIIFEYTSLGPKEAPNPEVVIVPPTPLEQTAEPRRITLRLKRAIPPDDAISVSVKTDPDTVWVYNEFGEGSSIQTSEGRIRWRKLSDDANKDLMSTNSKKGDVVDK